jgi:hypothetical protein
MFFVRKESIATTLGTQKEKAAAGRRGIGFFSHTIPATTADGALTTKTFWIYLWPASMLEEGIKQAVLAAMPPREPGDDSDELPAPPSDYIWAQEVTVGELVGEPLIAAIANEDEPWMDTAKALVNPPAAPVAAIAEEADAGVASTTTVQLEGGTAVI